MLQRGMNFREAPGASVVLMSRRRGAPYEDEVSDDGTQVIYEGHDAPRSAEMPDPKAADQPMSLPSGKPTENAKFARACGQGALARVYEKLQPGIWTDKGLFELVSYDYVQSGCRKVFKFHMRLADIQGEGGVTTAVAEFSRAIPSWVKQDVYKRDKGRCVICGAQDQLHFDHDLPFSKGGTAMKPENVRILCARHNLQKGARIE